GVTGFADPEDAATLDADVGLLDAGVIDDQRVRDHDVERLLLGGAVLLAHPFAQHFAAAELALVAVDREVALDLEPQRGVAEAHFVARRRARDVRVFFSAESLHEW